MNKPNPPEVSALVLSDIHFGSFSVSPDFENPNSKRQFISNAASMKDSLVSVLRGRKIDVILVPGDLTSTAKPSEFRECYRVICEIAALLSVDMQNVLLTYGNHDADWTISRLASNSPEEQLYHEISAHVGPVLLDCTQPNVLGPVPGCGIFRRPGFVVFSLNSGYYCTTDQKYPHGRIGIDQLNWIRAQSAEDFEPEDNWHILMVHHHPRKYSYPTTCEDISSIEEGSELLDIIGKGNFDIICHGHRHHPKIFTHMESGWKSPKTFVCAGSVAVDPSHRNNGEFPNMFHVIVINGRDPKDRFATGIVESYSYNSQDGWLPHVRTPVVPIDHKQHFGPAVGEEMLKLTINDLVQNALASTSDSLVELPAYNDLPINLKCVSHFDLNKLFCEVVSNSVPGKLYGSFPNEVAIKRGTS